jgi:hypothetical protein
MNTIFVFGSNLAGIHGKGSALAARKSYGAELGVGEGRTGNSYAIPTKDKQLKVLSLKAISESVNKFKDYAEKHQDLRFVVVKVGCGLAGYSENNIKPMFTDSPANCELPKGWRD